MKKLYNLLIGTVLVSTTFSAHATLLSSPATTKSSTSVATSQKVTPSSVINILVSEVIPPLPSFIPQISVQPSVPKVIVKDVPSPLLVVGEEVSLRTTESDTIAREVALSVHTEASEAAALLEMAHQASENAIKVSSDSALHSLGKLITDSEGGNKFVVSKIHEELSELRTLKNNHHEYDGDDHEHGHHTPPISPVPEAETYSMMLLGLGLVGFMSRRRRTN